MFRARIVVAVPILLTVTAACSAQSANSASATCNLEDGRQVRINYTPVTAKTDKTTNGKPWSPGGAAMTLFTEAPLGFASSTIPVGAYSVYPIPGRDKWVLAVNKNVTAGSPYDEKQDIARGPIETDQVPQAADTLEVAFAHVGSRCTLRIYFGKVATFAEFIAK
jgi:Protein of unknown function (DUF2911)